jgi:zinc protease
VQTKEPEQFGERRIEVARAGTTAYVKLAYHAPGVNDADFFPMLVLDAILTGAKGINLWSSFRTPPPQRSARLYRALVEGRLASAVSAGLLPTEHPFLYLISATVMDGITPADVEAAATATLEHTARGGVTEEEVAKAKNQLRARLVFENDSVTNLGHQLGFFETVANVDIFRDAPRSIAAVTKHDVDRAAERYLRGDQRTVGWFKPTPGVVA